MKFHFLFYSIFAFVFPLISSAEQSFFAQTLVNKYVAEMYSLSATLPNSAEQRVNAIVENIKKLIEEYKELCDIEEKKQLNDAALGIIASYIPVIMFLSDNLPKKKLLSLFEEHILLLFEQHATLAQSDKEKIIELDVKTLAYMTMCQQLLPFLRSADEAQKERINALLREKILDYHGEGSVLFHSLLASVNFSQSGVLSSCD